MLNHYRCQPVVVCSVLIGPNAFLDDSIEIRVVRYPYFRPGFDEILAKRVKISDHCGHEYRAIPASAFIAKITDAAEEPEWQYQHLYGSAKEQSAKWKLDPE